MDQLVAAVGVGIVVFASTNVDDILLLAVFLSDPAFTTRQVIAGQFLGITVLTAVSAACALLAVAVPAGFIGLLGLVPLFLGIRGLWRLRRAKGDAAEEEEPSTRAGGSPVLAVAGVTIANGGDNLGVYIPMFSSAPRLMPLYVAVFSVMTAILCVLSYYLVNNPLLGKRLARYGRVALPVVLVALGLWILADAKTLIWPASD